MKLRQTLCGLALVGLTCSVAAHAQRPVPAGRGVSPIVDPLPNDPAQVSPDTNTLAGAQLFGVGSLNHARNVFDPSISFSELGQTFPPCPVNPTKPTCFQPR